MEQMEGDVAGHIVVEDAEHTAHRYTAFQEKALRRLAHSKLLWAEAKESKAKLKAAAEGATDAQVDVESPKFDVWQACASGKVKLVKRFVEKTGFDLRCHNDAPRFGGDTLLHIAVWHGQAEMVKYLIDAVRSTYGEDDLDDYVNAADTNCNRATPLILAARTMVGMLNDRLAVCKALVDAGADIEVQDTFGDTALHWAARTSSLPIVRYFSVGTEGVIFAATADNYQREKALDVAEKADSAVWRRNDDCARDPSNRTYCTTCAQTHYSSYQTLEVYRLLLALLKGCNMRLKIRKGKARRLAQEAKRGAQLKAWRDDSIKQAATLLAMCKAEFVKQMTAAEKYRTDEEQKEMEIAGQAAFETQKKYIETTKEGKSLLKDWVKTFQAQVEKEDDEQAAKKAASTGRLIKEFKMSKSERKAAAKQLAYKKLCGDHAEQAMEAAKDRFRERNPPEEVHEPRKGEFRDIHQRRAEYERKMGIVNASARNDLEAAMQKTAGEAGVGKTRDARGAGAPPSSFAAPGGPPSGPSGGGRRPGVGGMPAPPR